MMVIYIIRLLSKHLKRIKTNSFLTLSHTHTHTCASEFMIVPML